MKQIPFLTSLLFLSANASATPCLFPTDGFRFGAGVGADFTILTGDLKDNHIVFTREGNSSRSINDKKAQFSPSLEGGYFTKSFYFGVVGSWHFGKLKDNNRIYLGSKKYINKSFESGHDFKLTFKTGPKLFERFIPYILSGISIDKYKSEVAFIDSSSNKPFVASSNTKSGYNIHPILGLGLEVLVANNVSCSLQYTHAFKREVKNRHHSSTKFSQYIGDGEYYYIPKSGILYDRIKYAKDVVSLKVTVFF